MKKFIKTLAATLATVLVFGMTVSAASSPDTSKNTSNSTDPAKSVAVQNMMKEGATKGVLADGKTTIRLEMCALADEKTEEYFGAFCRNNGYTLQLAFDMTASGNTNFTAFFKVPFQVNNKAFLLHYNESSKSVDCQELTQVEDQLLAGQIKSCSPFAIVTGSGNAATAVVAPKTGEVIALAAILAIVMMAGAVVCARKARLQK